jgi:hypothetical protein
MVLAPCLHLSQVGSFLVRKVTIGNLNLMYAYSPKTSLYQSHRSTLALS